MTWNIVFCLQRSFFLYRSTYMRNLISDNLNLLEITTLKPIVFVSKDNYFIFNLPISDRIQGAKNLTNYKYQ